MQNDDTELLAFLTNNDLHALYSPLQANQIGMNDLYENAPNLLSRLSVIAMSQPLPIMQQFFKLISLLPNLKIPEFPLFEHLGKKIYIFC